MFIRNIFQKKLIQNSFNFVEIITKKNYHCESTLIKLVNFKQVVPNNRNYARSYILHTNQKVFERPIPSLLQTQCFFNKNSSCNFYQQVCFMSTKNKSPKSLFTTALSSLQAKKRVPRKKRLIEDEREEETQEVCIYTIFHIS